MPPDAFAPLTAEERSAAPAPPLAPPGDGWTPVVPVPPDAPVTIPRHRLGTPARVWGYLNEDGALLFRVARFNEPGGGKQTLPLSWCRHEDGRAGWRWKALPAPRPLYGLDRLAASLDAPVLVIEGEKAADAAAVLFSGWACITSPGGAKAAGKADWGPLKGRIVTIWPDNDSPGRAYSADVARLALTAGAAAVRVVEVPAEWPEAWDLADAPPPGVNADLLTAMALAAPDYVPPPAPAVPDGARYQGPFRITERGIERRIERQNRETGETEIEWRWFSSPLEVVAETRDADGKNWGRLLRVETNDGGSNTWAMPMAMLAGSGEEYRGMLHSLGLTMAPGLSARQYLHEYVSTCRPTARVRCVSRIGWHGMQFVLPDAAFGEAGGEDVILQSAGTVESAFRLSGTLASWKAEVAAPCVGNSRLTLALSVAFAAPLLNLIGAESGGFHLRGGSSTGKTTALAVAGSVWGGGGVRGYLRSWRATDNGLEGLAALHCDSLLCLDEISQLPSQAAGPAAYALANGCGKSRAARGGEVRAAAEWRLLFLSSGEIGLADKMAEDGRARRAAAGQEIRIIDLPADAGEDMGIFEALHQFATPESLARHLTAASARNYGHAARAFLAKLTADPGAAAEAVRRTMQSFRSQVPEGADGQVQRAANRFALVAGAGELAASWGIVPWPHGEALRAALRCFGDWLVVRGGSDPAEERHALEAVRHFIQANGTSRFEVTNEHADPERVRIVNRAGFRRETAAGTEFMIFPEVWRAEICAGLDPHAVARALARRKFLVVKDGRFQDKQRIPGMTAAIWLYHLKPEILGET